MKLASIETITSIRPHRNADRLELATILGWQAVVKKGEFREGDRCVFVVIDTILPNTEWSSFLADKNNPDKPIRLHTVKLRGEYSQGLVLPITVLPEHMRGWQIGADVGGEMGVKKYEKETPAVLSGDAKGAFPTHYAPRTDEDNGLSNPHIVDMVLEGDIYVTLKLDGSSCTIVWDREKGILDVCSRNLSLAKSERNAFWKVAERLRFDLLHPDFNFLVIQGELMGPGIQGNQLELKEPRLFVFQVRNKYEWFNHSDAREIALMLGADVPPLLNTHVPQTLQSLQEFADAQVLPNGKPAEGIVVRPAIIQPFGDGRPVSFKIINRNYGE